MKKFGKMLLVFALVAVMLGSAFGIASAEDSAAEKYWKSITEKWSKWFDVMKYHGVGETGSPMPWDTSYYLANDGSSGGGHYNPNHDGEQKGTREASLSGDDNTPAGAQWVDFVELDTTCNFVNPPVTIAVQIQRLYQNGQFLNVYRPKDIYFTEGAFKYVTFGKLETNVYRATFCWHVEGETILPGIHDDDGIETPVMEDHDEVCQLVFDFNELFAEEEPDEPTPDPNTHLHLWGFEGFEWNTDNGIKAYAVYTCKGVDCDEQNRVEATVTQLSHGIVSEFEASVTVSQSLDRKDHAETMTILPTFGGFEWDTTNGVKAYAIYVCNVPGCFDHEARIAATVSKVSGRFTVATKYKAVITADQAPDGVERSETKNIIPSIPVKPRVRIDDGIIAPPKEMKPGDGVIAPPVDLNPVFP